MRECYIYARVSTKDQEREGYSIPAQLELLRAYALKHGLQIKQEFEESETAGKIGRTQFKTMTDLLRKPKSPKIVLVEKTDRLTRNFKDYVLIDDLANEHGVVFHLVKENEVIGKDASSHTKMIQGIKVVLAKNYIDNLREETKKGILQKVKSGGWSWQAPYGYKMQKGALLIDPEKAPFVVKAFELYSQGGYSLDSLRDALYDEGFFYSGSKPKAPKTQLHNIIVNPVYKGEVHYQGITYPGIHQPLVAQQVWNDANRMLTGRTVHKGRKQDFIFHGLLTCGECGSLLCGEVKRQGRYTYYRCWRSTTGQGCTEKYINESEITKTLTSILERLHFPPDYKARMRVAYHELKEAKHNTFEDERKRINGELARIQTKLARIYDDRIEGLIDEQVWRLTKQKYEAQAETLGNNLTKLATAEVPFYDQFDQFLELPEMLSRTWVHGTMEEKAELAKLLTYNISIKAKKVTVELDSPFDYFYKTMALKGIYPTLDELINTVSLHKNALQALFVKFAA